MVRPMSEGPEKNDDEALSAMTGPRTSTRQLLLFALAGALVAALLAGAAHFAAQRDRAATAAPAAAP